MISLVGGLGIGGEVVVVLDFLFFVEVVVGEDPSFSSFGSTDGFTLPEMSSFGTPFVLVGDFINRVGT